MSSANFFNGYSVDKPSSKVINPPGGRSNNIFGAFAEEPKAAGHDKKAPENNNDSNIFGNNSNKSNVYGDDSKSMSQKPSSKRGGFNPITGQPYDDDKPANKPHVDAEHQAQQQTSAPPANNIATSNNIANKQNEEPQATTAPGSNLHTSSRVLQPPGGKSTKLW